MSKMSAKQVQTIIDPCFATGNGHCPINGDQILKTVRWQRIFKSHSSNFATIKLMRLHLPSTGECAACGRSSHAWQAAKTLAVADADTAAAADAGEAGGAN